MRCTKRGSKKRGKVVDKRYECRVMLWELYAFIGKNKMDRIHLVNRIVKRNLKKPKQRGVGK